MPWDGRGRWTRWNRRRTVDELPRLDVVGVARRLPRGARPVALEATHGGRTERLLLEWTEQANVGGWRAWWLCPGCGRRCRYLYGGGRVPLRCRVCHGLTYPSSQKSKAKRPLVQVQARMWTIRRRLGAVGGLWDPLPERPRGMPGARYARLVGEYALLRTLDVAFLCAAFGAYPVGIPTPEELWAHYQHCRTHPVLLEEASWWELYKRLPGWSEPERLTLGELAALAGVSYAFAREAAAADLVRPDWGRGTRRKRYRPGLAKWLSKLARLREAGLSWDDITAWVRRRWDPGHEHERAWPEGVEQPAGDSAG